MKPTEDDMRRDLAADLETCNRAQRGEWFVTMNGIEYGTDSGGGILISLNGYDCLTDEDESFIVSSRAGWPAAVRRAMAAEASREQLFAAIKRHHDQKADDRSKVDVALWESAEME